MNRKWHLWFTCGAISNLVFHTDRKKWAFTLDIQVCIVLFKTENQKLFLSLATATLLELRQIFLYTGFFLPRLYKCFSTTTANKVCKWNIKETPFSNPFTFSALISVREMAGMPGFVTLCTWSLGFSYRYQAVSQGASFCSLRIKKPSCDWLTAGKQKWPFS